jgi:hypothetical protein
MLAFNLKTWTSKFLADIIHADMHYILVTGKSFSPGEWLTARKVFSVGHGETTQSLINHLSWDVKLLYLFRKPPIRSL